MPGRCHRSHLAAVLRRGLAIAAIAVVAGTSGCGAAPPVAPAAPVAGRVRSADQWRREFERRVLRGDDRGAAVALGRARAAGARGVRLELFAAITHWRTGDKRAALRAQSRVLAAARAGKPRAWRAVSRLAAFHVGVRKSPADAIALLAPLRGDCGPARACAVVARVIVAVAPAVAAPVALVDAFAPAGDPERGLSWRVAVARDLAANRRWGAADALVRALRKGHPRDVRPWAAALFAARRRRGPHQRARWLAELRASHPDVAFLDRLLVTRDVAGDRLLVAEIRSLQRSLPGATEEHQVEYVRALVRNEVLGSPPGSAPREELRRIAREQAGLFESREARRALARALLRVSLPEEAAPIVGALAANAEPIDLVLLAELRRQHRDAAGARRAADRAFRRAADKVRIAMVLASQWRRAWPAEARRWSRRARRTPGSISGPALREQVVAALQRSRPAPGTTAEVNRYVRWLLAEAAALPPPPAAAAQRAELQRARDHLTNLLVTGRRRASAWRDAAFDTLQQLSRSPMADAEVHFQFARVAARQRRRAALLAAYGRARAAAEREGVQLDDEALLADLAASGRGSILAAWLNLSGMEEAEDLDLTWRVARRLLDGAYRLTGRLWLERCLLRVLGGASVRVRLPRRAGSRVAPRAGRSPVIRARDLEHLATVGAADLVLEYITELRRRAVNPTSPVLRARLSRAEFTALIAVGRRRRAEDLLRDLVRRASKDSQRYGLMRLAFAHNLCRPTREMALRLVASRDHRIFRGALEAGLVCARELGDRRLARGLAARAARAQIKLSLHLTLGELLARHGFARLAVQEFDRIIDGRAYARSQLLPYAKALLEVGRSRDATAILRRLITMSRRRPHEYRRAIALLQAHDRLDEARALAADALKDHPGHAVLRATMLMLRMRADAMEGFEADVEALLRHGADEGVLRGIGLVARRTGHLRRLYEAVRAVPRTDRTVERFRLELAGVLGLRKQVVAVVRLLRDRGHLRGSATVRWLHGIGAVREARSVAAEVLASDQPASRGGAGAERAAVLREAMKVRRDPSSGKEALGVARLFVGRSLDRDAAASLAAEQLDELGLSRSALAFADAAVQGDGGGARALCRRGAIAWRAGERKQALRSWRAASASLLLRRRNPGVRGRMTAQECLRVELARAGLDDELRDLLERSLDADPTDHFSWRRLITLHLDRHELPQAVVALREALEHVPQRWRRLLRAPAQRIRAEGGGELLARWFAGGPELRSDPWWLAFAVDVIRDHAHRAGEAGRTRLRRILALARSSPDLRLRLALMWSARGEPGRASEALGEAPFVQRGARSPRGRQLIARAVAAVLIGVYRRTERPREARGPERVGPAPGDDHEERGAGEAASAALLARYRPTMSRRDATLVAGQLVIQGYPRLASRVLSACATAQPTRRDPTGERERLRVAIAGEDDTETLRVARVYVRRVPGSGGPRLPEPRERLALRLLAMGGRPGVALRLARELAAPGRPSAAAVGVFAGDPTAAGPTRFAEMVRAYDPGVLIRMRGPPAGMPRETALGACRVALAAGRPRLALRWTSAVAALDDEPWRAWRDLATSALAFADAPTAREALRRAARLGAPEGTSRCVRLWLERAGTVAACIAGRPLERLPAADLGALALAAARGVDLTGSEALLPGLARISPARQLDFVGGLTLHRWALDRADLARARAFVRRLLAAIPRTSRRDALVNMALDDLAAIGVAGPGVELTGRALRRRPTDHFARNNAAYALFLAGSPLERVLTLGRRALATGGGDSAHALLDTLAAALWKAGQRQRALRLQRHSMAATTSRYGSDHAPESRAGLPLVRLAEFELALGHPEEARLLALLALDRERLYSLLGLDLDAHAATGLPGVQALLNGYDASDRARLLERAGRRDTGTPVTIARARAVIASVLRRLPKPNPPLRPSTKAVQADGDAASRSGRGRGSAALSTGSAKATRQIRPDLRPTAR